MEPKVYFNRLAAEGRRLRPTADIRRTDRNGLVWPELADGLSYAKRRPKLFTEPD
jgi:hypothetical protein